VAGDVKGFCTQYDHSVLLAWSKTILTLFAV